MHGFSMTLTARTPNGRSTAQYQWAGVSNRRVAPKCVGGNWFSATSPLASVEPAPHGHACVSVNPPPRVSWPLGACALRRVPQSAVGGLQIGVGLRQRGVVVFQTQDAGDAGQVDPRVNQCADPLQPGQVVGAVAPGSAVASSRRPAVRTVRKGAVTAPRRRKVRPLPRFRTPRDRTPAAPVSPVFSVIAHLLLYRAQKTCLSHLR